MIFNYVTTNTKNGKKYIGSHSGSVEDNYLGSGKALKLAVKKYGRENFVRDVLSVTTTREEAFFNERFLIEMYKTMFPLGYNLSPTGGTECCGSHSEKSIQKMSKAKTGSKHSDEAKKKMSEASKGRAAWSKGLTKGISCGVMKISKAMSNRVISDDTRRNMSEAAQKRKRNPHSDETKKKIGESHKGLIPSDEARKKMSEAHLGIVPWNKGLTKKNDKRVMGTSLAQTGEKGHNYGKRGKDSCKSKPILQYNKEEKFIKEWECASQATRKLGIGKSNIGACALGKTKSSGGFIWKFKETENK